MRQPEGSRAVNAAPPQAARRLTRDDADIEYAGDENQWASFTTKAMAQRSKSVMTSSGYVAADGMTRTVPFNQEEAEVEEAPSAFPGGEERTGIGRKSTLPDSVKESAPLPNASMGYTPSGRYVRLCTEDERSAFFCHYGWIVGSVPQVSPPPKSKEDIDAANMLTDQERSTWLSTRSRAAEKSLKPSYLMANALYIVRTALIAGLLAAWPSTGTSGPGQAGSILQAISVIIVESMWLIYLVFFLPFTPVVTLLCELTPSAIELVVFCMAASQAMTGQAGATSSGGMMVLLLMETGFVTVLEAVRAWNTNSSAWRHKALMAEEELEKQQHSRAKSKRKNRRRRGRRNNDEDE
jgi:hypothetical protein